MTDATNDYTRDEIDKHKIHKLDEIEIKRKLELGFLRSTNDRLSELRTTNDRRLILTNLLDKRCTIYA